MKSSKKIERPFMAAQLLSALLAAALVANASALHQGALRKVTSSANDQNGNIRMQICGYCSKLCPIACFAGACPDDYTEMHTVMKFQQTGQCFSCDPAVSVGVSANNDFAKCESPSNSLPGGEGMDGGLPGDSPEGPQGPAVPGDSGSNALKAVVQAKIAHEAATKAAELAKLAADTADGDKNAGDNSLLRVKRSEDPVQEAQVEAENALQKSKVSHSDWKAALTNYNKQVWILRKQGLETAAAEREMEAARELSQKARSNFAIEKQAGQDALRAVAMLSGAAGSRIERQFSSEEMAGAAQAGHRRLLVAARAASDAMGKLNSVTSRFVYPSIPLEETLPPPKFTIPEALPPKPPKEDPPDTSASRVFAVEPGDVPTAQSLLLAAGISQGRITASDEDDVEVPVLPSLPAGEAANIEQQMTQNLEQRLTANPAAIEDASLFAIPALPAMPAALPEAMV